MKEALTLMKKAESAVSPGRVLVTAVLSGLIITLLLMMVGAAAVNSGSMGDGSIPLVALCCIAAGALACAFLAARLAVRSRFLWGLAGGGLLFACLLLGSFAWLGSPISLPRVAVNAATVLVMSSLGGLAGASIRKKRHRKK